MKDMLPDAYVDENTQILFENRNKGFSIRYAEESGMLSIGEGNESFLKGDTFDTWLTNTLKAIFDAHVHTGVSTGGGTSGPPVTGLTTPSGHLSDTIKGE